MRRVLLLMVLVVGFGLLGSGKVRAATNCETCSPPGDPGGCVNNYVSPATAGWCFHNPQEGSNKCAPCGGGNPPAPTPARPAGRIQGCRRIGLSGIDSISNSQVIKVNDSSTSPLGADCYAYQIPSLTLGGLQVVKSSVPSGYQVGYSLCYDRTDCHTTTNTYPGNVAVVANDSISSYADLWWHYTLLPSQPAQSCTITSAGVNPLPIVQGSSSPLTVSWSGSTVTLEAVSAPSGLVTIESFAPVFAGAYQGSVRGDAVGNATITVNGKNSSGSNICTASVPVQVVPVCQMMQVWRNGVPIDATTVAEGDVLSFYTFVNPTWSDLSKVKVELSATVGGVSVQPNPVVGLDVPSTPGSFTLPIRTLPYVVNSVPTGKLDVHVVRVYSL